KLGYYPDARENTSQSKIVVTIMIDVKIGELLNGNC
ncbi:unnamed protein product, partial [marine sediment metagenome]